MGETDASKARGTKKGHGRHAGDDKVMETGEFVDYFAEKEGPSADDVDSWAMAEDGRSIRDDLNDLLNVQIHILGPSTDIFLFAEPNHCI